MSSKITIVMLHGFRGTHHGLELIGKNLKNFKVIIPDMPGFAEGDTLDTYDLDSYIAWLKMYIASLRLSDRPVLVGHSFGSIIGSAYAAKYPRTVSKLVLINPIGAPALEGPRAIFTKLAAFYYWAGNRLPKSLAYRWLTWPFVINVITVSMAKTKDKELRAFIYAEHHEHFNKFHTSQSVKEGFRTSVTYSVRDFAPLIKLPTLIIAADKDDLTSLQKQHELQELFKNADLAVIKNVGHLTHYEAPDLVAKFIQGFIKRS